MSDELQDEVEAINSIYGDGTLAPADGDDNNNNDKKGTATTTPTTTSTYILKLPGGASQLRLSFPAAYPTHPPDVLGTHHASGGKKGAGARDLGLFREALSGVFEEGVVCIFDAVEEFGRRYDEEVSDQEPEEEGGRATVPPAAAAAAGGGGGTSAHQSQSEEGQEAGAATALEDLPSPPWTVSAVFEENKSTFVAHVAPVTSPSQARLYTSQLLASDRRIRSATHNMTAWRIRGAGGASYQDCDDDGEAAAGGRLLHLMQLMELWDAMVVVTRWYGGVKLGPRRFAVINATAKDGFVRAGMVPENGKEKKKKGKAK